MLHAIAKLLIGTIMYRHEEFDIYFQVEGWTIDAS